MTPGARALVFRSGDWDAWRDSLAAELASLADGEFLNTTGPVRTRDRGPGWFGRPRPPEVLSAPLVAYLGIDGHLLAESVPAFPVGDAEPDEGQLRALSAAGWLMPGDEGYTTTGEDVLRVYIPRAEAVRAADLAVRTYRILGVADPAAVAQERG